MKLNAFRCWHPPPLAGQPLILPIARSLFSGHGCAGLRGHHSRWGGEEVGRATSIRSEKSESRVAAAMGVSSAGGLLWSRKERTLLRVYEAYELCLTHRASRSDKSAERPPEGGFEGIKEVPILIPRQCGRSG